MSIIESDRVNVRDASEIESGTGLDTDAKLAMDAKLESEVMASIKLAFEPTDKLKRQIALGKAFVNRAIFRKRNTAKWDRKTYSDLAKSMEDRAAFEMSINEVRLDVSAKIYAFVEAVKPIAPNVAKVSYYRIANHFLPMFDWNVSDLEGVVKKEWLGFIRENINANAELGGESKPVSIAELKEAIESRKEEIKSDRVKADKRTPEQIDQAEQKAENAKIVAKRNNAIGKISKAVSDAFSDTNLNGQDVADTIASVATTFNVEIPSKVELVKTGFDPATMTVAEVQTMMAVLFHSGKISEIKACHDIASQMLAAFSASTVKMAS